MKKTLVVVAVIVVMAAMFVVAIVPAQAGQAGRDNTRNVLIGGVLLCQFVNCRQVASNIFKGGTETITTTTIMTMGEGGNLVSAGERAAYLSGQSDALAELQAAREREAYNLGRSSVGNIGGFGNFGGFGSGCYGDCGSSPFSWRR